jgi:anti-sigma regulatory factor (Ser/Thr protein kinase)
VRDFPYNSCITSPAEARAEFPPEAASAGRARRFVDGALRRWSCDDMLDVAVLLVSELVANAVLHARTPIGVVIRLNGDRLRIEVHDGELRAPARKHYSSMSTTGRGLVLVERLARDWGVAAEKDGKSVWFELDPSTALGPSASAVAFDLDVDLGLGLDLDPFAVGDSPSSDGALRGPSENQGHAQLRLLVGAGVS